MTIESIRSLGVDVSKSSVTCHILTQYPVGGLKTYWQKNRTKANTLFPSFYSSPKHKSKQKSAFDFADYVIENKPDVAILEPTGNHYSRLWARILESLEIKILWVGHIELRRYRGGKNLPNKSDEADALAMAAYAVDQENYLETGELNPRQFLMHRPQLIDELRELVQQLEHLNRVQSPIINYTRQTLAWQFPEKAHSKTESTKLGNVPPLWGWLAERKLQVHPPSYKSISRQYEQSAAVQFCLEIDPTVRLHAGWLCDIDIEEQRLETKLKSLVNDEQFKAYNQIFDQFNFGLRIRARLLSRIYPFEAFLSSDGKQLTEREVREVKKKQVTRENGKSVVKFLPGDIKRVKRNRSRDAFKLRLGMGTVLEQSGDKLVEKGAGSALCRMNFWQYVIAKIEVDGRLPDNPIGNEIAVYKETLKKNVDGSGKQMLNGKHLQNKLMSKVANLLFRELSRAIAKS
ncbi:MAG: transposase [Nostoc sp. NMS1]|uniref:IS110 family transposase n=1 Tax=unclassified Nostoc TaxID=2593658 RepID=UPI0025D3746C|nr:MULTISPECIES: transposase [unclassified Nostoc]MBN3905133.1 transposase [Nostoc sp. NMS1]MBN3989238.1 transposase [Nostoc sp. NMS2]